MQRITSYAPARRRRVLAGVTLALASVFPGFAADIGVEAVRLPDNPIIEREMFVAAGVPEDGDNINGPALIRVPEWIPRAERADPAADYYLYFADHGGTYIRMAWAERVGGPYHLHRPGRGVLTLERPEAIPIKGPGRRWIVPLDEHLAFGHHVASPDVHVDDEQRRIVMFFHAYSASTSADKGHQIEAPDGTLWYRTAQRSFVAISPDGLDFDGRVLAREVGPPYLRYFQAVGRWYASSYHTLYATADPSDILSGLLPIAYGNIDVFRARHTAVRVGVDDAVTLFFSRKKAAPEHIEYASIDNLPEGADGRWSTHPARTLLVPEHDWEGADLPVRPSSAGDADERLHELRDPAWFRDDDGREYLLYAIAGENGIGIAELSVVPPGESRQ